MHCMRRKQRYSVHTVHDLLLVRSPILWPLPAIGWSLALINPVAYEGSSPRVDAFAIGAEAIGAQTARRGQRHRGVYLCRKGAAGLVRCV